MNSSIENKQKAKLSLQRKVKKSNAEIVQLIRKPENQLNETCEFRSTEKMQKFFNNFDQNVKKDVSKKCRSVRRNLNIKETNSMNSAMHTEDGKTDSNSDMFVKDKELNVIYENISEDNEVKDGTSLTDDKNGGEICSINSKTKNSDEIIDVDVADGEELTSVTCVVCGTICSSKEMQLHLQSCLKTKFQRNVSSDGKPTVENVLIEEQKSDNDNEEESFFCQICQKDLTRLNSQRRTQHLNRCMDKEEEEKKMKEEEKKSLEDAKTAVLDCPMCGRPCKTQNARKVHVKKCCQKLNVSTEQMLKLMKKQEDERQMLIAAGVVPKSTVSKLKNKSGSSTVLSKTKKTVKEPRSQFDADLQMAMAISMSESRTVEKQEPKKVKKKKGPGDPSLLVALTEEEKRQRLQQRVSNMLVPQVDVTDIELTPEFTDSSIENKYITEDNKNLKLWTICSLLEENKENSNIEQFYVGCLVPPIEITKVIPGSKVRRMSQIPGRETSFIKPRTPEKLTKSQISRSSSLSETISGQSDDTMVISTQTAVVLAELAADATQSSYSNITQTSFSTPELNCSGFCPEEPLEFEHTQSSDLVGNLQKSLLTMVNQRTHSDVQIDTDSGEIVYGHKVIIGSRCPGLLQIEENGHIRLADVSSDSVISMMKYLYGGLISVKESCLSDISDMANRFCIDELQEILKGFQQNSNRIQNSPTKVSTCALPEKISVDSLLKQLWSDSEEETDEDYGTKDTISDNKDNIHSDMEDEVNVSDIRIEERNEGVSENAEHINELKSDLLNRKADSILKNNTFDENKISCKDGQDSEKLKQDSLIFEDDELEVYSNVSSPLEDSQQNAKSTDNENSVEEYNVICPNKEQPNEGNKLLPEIPMIKNSENDNPLCTQNQEQILPDYFETHAADSFQIRTDRCTRYEIQDELPRLESPRKSQAKPFRQKDKLEDKGLHGLSDDVDLPQIESPPKSRSKASVTFGRSMDAKNSLSVSYEEHNNDKPNKESNLPSFSTAGRLNTENYTEDNRMVLGVKAVQVQSSSYITNTGNSSFHDSSREDDNYSPKVMKENDTMHESFDKSYDSLIVIDDDSNHSNPKTPAKLKKIPEKENDVNMSRHNSSVMEDDNNDTGFNTCMDISGGDLFASPSPTIQNKNLSKIRLSSSESLNTSQSVESIQNENTNSPKFDKEMLMSPAFRKSKRKTQDMESSKGNSPMLKKFKLKTDIDDNNDDVAITSDNFSDKESDSPRFKMGEKRKFKFSSKSDFVKSADITFSGSTRADKEKQNVSSVSASAVSATYDNCSDVNIIDKTVKHNNSEIMSSTVCRTKGNSGAEFYDDECQINLTKSNFGNKIENDDDDFRNEVSLIDGGEPDQEVNTTVEYNMNISVQMDSGPYACVINKDDNDYELGGDGQNDGCRPCLDVTEIVAPEPYNEEDLAPNTCDVWDDFDDCGADDFGGVVDCNTPFKSGIIQSSQKRSTSTSNTETKVKHKESGVDKDNEEVKDFENLTFCEEDSYFEAEGIKPHHSSTNMRKNSFKTPVMNKEQRQRSKPEWKEPSPFTPMPNYDAMATPHLKKKVQSYGVRPVGKKRMIKLLKDIYHQTHQYETDSEFEDEILDDEKDVKKAEVKNNDMNIEILTEGSEDEVDDEFNHSQDSQVSDLIEESFMHTTEEENLPTKPGEKTLEENLMEFIKNQPDIKVQILMYEPLELDVLKKKITEADIKCSMDKLKEFLDDKCITFTMKNMRKSPRKKRRSPKKGRTKEGQGSPVEKQGTPVKGQVNPVKGQKNLGKGQGKGRKKLNP